MSLELVAVCAVVGVGTYLFRYLPTRLGAGRTRGRFAGPLGAFLGSVGVAAVAALLAASLEPYLVPFARGVIAAGPSPAEARAAIAAVLGALATAATFRWCKDVAVATLTGALVYGVTWWLT
ncbi:MAG: AzlD domain-containing protein [Truepera sp.]|nr:AzlD domain-containing protein [Truepera sp.]